MSSNSRCIESSFVLRNAQPEECIARIDMTLAMLSHLRSKVVT